MKLRKKLIEVALPLEAINEEASRRKRKAPSGYPTTLHKWWAQRPVAAARAVIFAQMVDDPSSLPDLFPTAKKQEKERQRLFDIIEDLVQWENTNNEKVLQAARDEIWQSWRRACAEHADHPDAKQLFNRNQLPAFNDPFTGSGALPMEAQRLGLAAYASDLNPVAVMITKATIELPAPFAGRPPVNATAGKCESLFKKSWHGTEGLAEDIRFYGRWICEEAEKRIGHFYPKIEITKKIVEERPDLKPLLGKKLSLIACIWARTVKSPNPAFSHVEVPLASTFVLSNKTGKEAYVNPVIENGDYHFTVRVGKSRNMESVKRGTKLGGSGTSFSCVMSGTPMPFEYLRAEGKAGRMGVKLMAIVAEGERGRVYLSPTTEMESLALSARAEFLPEGDLPPKALGFRVQEYGMKRWRDLFTSRQLLALATLSDLVQEARQRVIQDAASAGLSLSGGNLDNGGSGAEAYADAVAVYLSFVLNRVAHYSSTICTWLVKDAAIARTFTKQSIPMTWDFAEGSVFGKSSTGWAKCCEVIASALGYLAHGTPGVVSMADAATTSWPMNRCVISTDPPYFNNIGYADLSDYFYIWLRRTLKPLFPQLFATLTVPKFEELVATPFRHGSREKGEEFFLNGMTKAMHRLTERSHPAFPVTIYYAFKQTETEDDTGTASTGWEKFLDAVVRAGFTITGTWPMRTEGDNRQVGVDANALASSVVLVCRPRGINAKTATKRELANALKSELPPALAHLQSGNIAPVDLAQAAIGPGMAVYTRYAKVLDAEGKTLSVREALALINQTLDDALAEQEGDFDADSRWALAWFEQQGFAEGEFGVANVLAQAKNTGMNGLVDAGIIESKRGKVRLFKPDELPKDWDPSTDNRLTNWEMVHHLIRVLQAGGEGAAAILVAQLGTKAETARELCYRLYTLCERKKRATEALSYNALVQSWPEITRLAREGGKPQKSQPALFEE
jgi:putative DNA methylase